MPCFCEVNLVIVFSATFPYPLPSVYKISTKAAFIVEESMTPSVVHSGCVRAIAHLTMQWFTSSLGAFASTDEFNCISLKLLLALCLLTDTL